MGITSPKLLAGHVMHARLFPRINNFRYSIYYIAFPLSARSSLSIAHNRFAPMAFYDKDHGDGTDLEAWARNILDVHDIQAEGEIVLVCMPRILGYVFNPVSFWLCHDISGALKAVLCEVHNTFGEKHTYICAHADGRAITSSETMQGRKVFHVSPFLERDGSYDFRFDSGGEGFKAWIDYFDAEGKKQLITAVAGNFAEMTKSSCRRVFWQYPLVTFKTIMLIHYQAVKLILKKIKYVPKPSQKDEKTSAVINLTEM
jgi:uncharacterized protein